jgi:hypothetical protein
MYHPRKSAVQEASMPGKLFSRRDFSFTAIQSLAAALAMPRFQATQDFRHNLPSGDGWIRISFNENNYGPSPKALQALTTCGQIASRYPFSSEIGVADTLASFYGVKSENVILGCGSTEILRVADAAFLAPGHRACGRSEDSSHVGSSPRFGSHGRRVHLEDRPRLHLQPE